MQEAMQVTDGHRDHEDGGGTERGQEEPPARAGRDDQHGDHGQERPLLGGDGQPERHTREHPAALLGEDDRRNAQRGREHLLRVAPAHGLEGQRAGHEETGDRQLHGAALASFGEHAREPPGDAGDDQKQHQSADAVAPEVSAEQGGERRPEHQREATHDGLQGEELARVPGGESVDRRAGVVAGRAFRARVVASHSGGERDPGRQSDQQDQQSREPESTSTHERRIGHAAVDL